MNTQDLRFSKAQDANPPALAKKHATVVPSADAARDVVRVVTTMHVSRQPKTHHPWPNKQNGNQTVQQSNRNFNAAYQRRGT